MASFSFELAPFLRLIAFRDRAQTLSHRGPDNFGELAEPYTYFAHLRLSIQDLSDAATTVFTR